MTVKLTDAEWKIMNLLWDNGEMTVAQLTEQLAGQTGWGRHTIISFLKRLVAKSAVSYRQKGSSRAYFAKTKRAGIAADETRNLLDKAFSGSLSLMLSTILKENILSDDELIELEAILKRLDPTSDMEKKAAKEADDGDLP